MPVKASSNTIQKPVSKAQEENLVITQQQLREKRHYQQNFKSKLSFDQEEDVTPTARRVINFDEADTTNNKDNAISGGSGLHFNESQGKTTVTSSSSKEEQEEMASQTAGDKNSKKKVSCNCKKSKCLKLYCDCFAVDGFCGRDCNCTDCYNNLSHQKERQNAINAALERNPNAFKPKIQKDELATEVLLFLQIGL